jgi:alkylhydroperoxidase/carboxymuconolactone decarboxylase family protein YurZ
VAAAASLVSLSGMSAPEDRVLFGEVWERPELSKRDRSLATDAALIAAGNIEQH